MPKKDLYKVTLQASQAYWFTLGESTLITGESTLITGESITTGGTTGVAFLMLSATLTESKESFVLFSESPALSQATNTPAIAKIPKNFFHFLFGFWIYKNFE